MTLSMYQLAVPPVLKMLNNVTAWLDKAAAFCAARKMDEQLLLNTRLYPDMFPFARQVQSLSDHAKGLSARLAAHEVPSFPDTETTIAELKARIAKTAEFVQSLHPSAFDGAETRTVTLVFGGGRRVELSGQDYLSHGAFPNFYFHATTAYDILRHLGVEIGKRDFLG
jgi:uncharacterized protein